MRLLKSLPSLLLAVAVALPKSSPPQQNSKAVEPKAAKAKPVEPDVNKPGSDSSNSGIKKHAGDVGKTIIGVLLAGRMKHEVEVMNSGEEDLCRAFMLESSWDLLMHAPTISYIRKQWRRLRKDWTIEDECRCVEKLLDRGLKKLLVDVGFTAAWDRDEFRDDFRDGWEMALQVCHTREALREWQRDQAIYRKVLEISRAEAKKAIDNPQHHPDRLLSVGTTAAQGLSKVASALRSVRPAPFIRTGPGLRWVP